MNKVNEVTLTGTFKTEQVTAKFAKQLITFASKNRDQQWEDGDFEVYIKPDLVQQSGIVSGDTARLKGFMVFSFFTKADGTKMSFPKLVVTEVQEIEKAGAAGAQQPQVQTYAAPTPPAFAAPTAPGMVDPATQQYAAPQAPTAPGMPQAPTMPA